MCAGLVHDMGGLIACRVSLSLAYKRRELGTRLSILLGSSPIANCIAGAMAYGISQIKSSTAPWRLIFLIGMCQSILIEDTSLTTGNRGRSHLVRDSFCLLLLDGPPWHRQVSDRRGEKFRCGANGNEGHNRKIKTFEGPVIFRTDRL
jgi:hypothetical protein